MKYKNLTVSQKGLSLIESAMVLAISAVIVSGVLYYYNQAQENRKLEEGIKQIQTIAATVNKLYTNSTARLQNGDDAANNKVVEAISAVSGIPTKKLSNSEAKVFTTPSGQWVQFWVESGSPINTYQLETQVQSVSSCISYATLNMGTIMAGKTKILIDGREYGNSNSNNSSNSTNFSLSPSIASGACEDAGKNKNGNNIKVRYTLRY